MTGTLLVSFKAAGGRFRIRDQLCKSFSQKCRPFPLCQQYLNWYLQDLESSPRIQEMVANKYNMFYSTEEDSHLHVHQHPSNLHTKSQGQQAYAVTSVRKIQAAGDPFKSTTPLQKDLVVPSAIFT